MPIFIQYVPLVLQKAEFKEKFEAGQIDGALQVGPRLIVDGKVAGLKLVMH